jgi:hypothetical protein
VYNEIINFIKGEIMRILLTLSLVGSLSLSALYAESGVLDIQWPKPNTKTLKPAIPYPDALKKGIKNTKLPVYIPSAYAYDKQMIVVAEENFYTINFILDGAILVITGDKTYQESVPVDNAEFKAIMKASPAVEFILAEGIMSANFNRHGVNYSLSVMCDNPEEDARCTQNDFLKKIYNSLIMVGGRP